MENYRPSCPERIDLYRFSNVTSPSQRLKTYPKHARPNRGIEIGPISERKAATGTCLRALYSPRTAPAKAVASCKTQPPPSRHLSPPRHTHTHTHGKVAHNAVLCGRTELLSTTTSSSSKISKRAMRNHRVLSLSPAFALTWWTALAFVQAVHRNSTESYKSPGLRVPIWKSNGQNYFIWPHSSGCRVIWTHCTTCCTKSIPSFW